MQRPASRGAPRRQGGCAGEAGMARLPQGAGESNTADEGACQRWRRHPPDAVSRIEPLGCGLCIGIGRRVRRSRRLPRLSEPSRMAYGLSSWTTREWSATAAQRRYMSTLLAITRLRRLNGLGAAMLLALSWSGATRKSSEQQRSSSPTGQPSSRARLPSCPRRGWRPRARSTSPALPPRRKTG